MARVYEEQPVVLERALGWLERLIYSLCGVPKDAGKRDMKWTTYAFAMLLFNGAGVLFVYLVQRLQGHLPLNPQGMSAPSEHLAWNTAISFATNTNWQSYGGETTMSHLTQMLALASQNFVSAASGMAVMVALVRGLARKQTDGIGNFWVDVVRGTLYILLPLSIVFAVFFVSQGVVQTLGPYQTVHTLQSGADQTLAVGPVASQLAIKQLGTNGGGFFNVNSAHPFENSGPLNNLVEIFAIILIPAALTYTFGKMVKDTRQGWAILIAMTAMFLPLLWLCVSQEQGGNPAFASLHVDQAMSSLQAGGNMEGKEVRFGISGTGLFATITTMESCGAVNGFHDSFTPLGGLVPMWLIQLGEVVFGGVGAGMYGILIFVIIAVFVSGLMVGRTPEYLGKKVEAYEMKMASLGILFPAATILVLTAIAVVTTGGRAGVFNPGPHGFSEVLYAYSSATNNNGSAFAGLGANNPFYDTTLGLAMFLGRFWVKIPVLALAGSLAKNKLVPTGPGTLPTHTPLFVGMLVATIVIVGALTFIPALALGPIVEHLHAH
jgi:K+-transporting ATPase ATPase A chain